ncbi:MAG: fructose bisphosphate aldolase [bacterium]|nr:fructose bisphosphate aldolase [bacterium]
MNHVGDQQDQRKKISTQSGFIAALDQSGGSTPKALSLYGVGEDGYSNEAEMFARVHEMRCRIIESPAFGGDRILGAILFENTLDGEIAGCNSAEYLWREKNVVPFLKVDKGLADEVEGVQVMKPMPDLAALLDKAKRLGVFGTKMRSVIKSANKTGITRVVEQQFEVGRQICAAGLVPIIEPEVDIHASDKAEAEALLGEQLLGQLDALDDQTVMLKLTLPEEVNLYSSHIAHASVARVVALSGGYSREEANRRLSANRGMIASFSRALTEGLSAQQPEDEFNRTLDASIEAICKASRS